MSETKTRVFISYRRAHTSHVAGRLTDALSHALGKDLVYLDVDFNRPGDDFEKLIRKVVGRCGVLLALMDSQWIEAVDNQGRRRIDDPDDMVVLEVGAALEQNVHVIPVLVDGANMPSKGTLPHRLRPLASRHAIRLDHGSFKQGIAHIVEAVKEVSEAGGAAALHRGDLDAAIEAYRNAGDDARAARARAYNERAHRGFANGDYGAAIRDGEAALHDDLWPPYMHDLGEFHLARARARRAHGDTQGAKTDYAAAIRYLTPEKKREVEREAAGIDPGPHRRRLGRS